MYFPKGCLWWFESTLTRLHYHFCTVTTLISCICPFKCIHYDLKCNQLWLKHFRLRSVSVGELVWVQGPLISFHNNFKPWKWIMMFWCPAFLLVRSQTDFIYCHLSFKFQVLIYCQPITRLTPGCKLQTLLTKHFFVFLSQSNYYNQSMYNY